MAPLTVTGMIVLACSVCVFVCVCVFACVYACMQLLVHARERMTVDGSIMGMPLVDGGTAAAAAVAAAGAWPLPVLLRFNTHVTAMRATRPGHWPSSC